MARVNYTYINFNLKTSLTKNIREAKKQNSANTARLSSYFTVTKKGSRRLRPRIRDKSPKCKWRNSRMEVYFSLIRKPGRPPKPRPSVTLKSKPCSTPHAHQTRLHRHWASRFLAETTTFNIETTVAQNDADTAILELE